MEPDGVNNHQETGMEAPDWNFEDAQLSIRFSHPFVLFHVISICEFPSLGFWEKHTPAAKKRHANFLAIPRPLNMKHMVSTWIYSFTVW